MQGDDVIGAEEYYESAHYGSVRGGEWFTDFWQSLDGRRIKPNHWPDGINIRYGLSIDRCINIFNSVKFSFPGIFCSIQIFYGSYRVVYTVVRVEL